MADVRLTALGTRCIRAALTSGSIRVRLFCANNDGDDDEDNGDMDAIVIIVVVVVIEPSLLRDVTVNGDF
jgi:hypothetical protein